MVINKTPHPVNVVKADGTIIHTFPKCELNDLIRLGANVQADEPIEGIPTSITVFGEATGLTEYTEGTYYIVSQLVKNALSHRTDLLVPADVLRDGGGNIIGCQSLGR